MWPLMGHDVNSSGGKIGKPIDHVDSLTNLGTPPEQKEGMLIGGRVRSCQQDIARKAFSQERGTNQRA